MFKPSPNIEPLRVNMLRKNQHAIVAVPVKFARMAVSPRIRHLGIVIALLSFIAYIQWRWPPHIDCLQQPEGRGTTTPDIKSEKLARLKLIDAAVPPPPGSCSDTTLTNAINRVTGRSKRSAADLAAGPVTTRCGRFHWDLKGTEFSVEGPNLCHAGMERRNGVLEGKCVSVR